MIHILDQRFNYDDSLLENTDFLDKILNGDLEYEIKLIDYGLAREIAMSDYQSELSLKENTKYRAPEIKCESDLEQLKVPKDTKCDLWSLTKIVYELFFCFLNDLEVD